MANHAMSDEEVQLRRRARRRLIGAVTMVTVMVIALPMVLDGESRQSGQDIAINIPSPGSTGEFASRAAPVQPKSDPASPHPQAEKAVQAKVSAETQAPQVAPPVPPAKVEEPAKVPAAEASVELLPAVKEPAPQAKHKDEKSAAATSRQESVPYVIHLGAFASPVNAKERQSRLTVLKVKFYTETVKTPSGDKLRVRAGPFATRQEAERVQAKLKAAGIQDGVVAEKK